MQHLSENVIFMFPLSPGSAEAQVTWGKASFIKASFDCLL